MKEFIKSNLKNIIICFAIIVCTPIILGIVLNIPTGYLTIGDENSWVSFFGSYTGGIIGGIVALIIARSQFINERKNFKLSQRSFLSATTITMNYEQKAFWRKNKGRVMTTEDYTKLSGNTCRTRFYSVVRYGGPEVITNCNFKIIVGIDEEFNQEQIIEVWVDFFERDEELLIPLCSSEFKGVEKHQPYVKEIKVMYETLAGEKMKFYQSESEKKKMHFIVGDNEETILDQDIQYTAFTQK
ncbi:hypothetical protein [Bacillus cereus]|uniref:hypothetical protein n=1 Tax=Bacillus cereus TaxID=1396 RepID=UPI0011AAC084|nr:hypothetical protein [Bacillus cereus]